MGELPLVWRSNGSKHASEEYAHGMIMFNVLKDIEEVLDDDEGGMKRSR